MSYSPLTTIGPSIGREASVIAQRTLTRAPGDVEAQVVARGDQVFRRLLDGDEERLDTLPCEMSRQLEAEYRLARSAAAHDQGRAPLGDAPVADDVETGDSGRDLLDGAHVAFSKSAHAQHQRDGAGIRQIADHGARRFLVADDERGCEDDVVRLRVLEIQGHVTDGQLEPRGIIGLEDRVEIPPRLGRARRARADVEHDVESEVQGSASKHRNGKIAGISLAALRSRARIARGRGSVVGGGGRAEQLREDRLEAVGPDLVALQARVQPVDHHPLEQHALGVGEPAR